MDELLDFKFKKGKNDKVILFIILKKKDINYSNEVKKQVVSKYVSIIEKNPGIYVCIDARIVNSCNKKLAWEGASDFYKYNDLFAKNIKAVSFMISNQQIINIVKLIEKVHPFLTPTKFCKDNLDALDFLYKN